MQTLPLWLQILTTAIATSLAGLKLFEYFKQPVLEVRVTNDSFFRLTQTGEAFFCHAVLLARNAAVLIKRVDITLRRVNLKGRRDRAEKSFPLEVLDYGEKVQGPNLRAEHYFSSRSPLRYINSSQPFLGVYYCFHKEYRLPQLAAGQAFMNELYVYKKKIEAKQQEEASEETAELRIDALREYDDLIKKHQTSMANLVQLEDGEYEVLLTIWYENPALRIFRKEKSASSTAYFTVTSDAVSLLKAQLETTLRQSAANILLGKMDTVTFPEHAPQDFRYKLERS